MREKEDTQTQTPDSILLPLEFELTYKGGKKGKKKKRIQIKKSTNRTFTKKNGNVLGRDHSQYYLPIMTKDKNLKRLESIMRSKNHYHNRWKRTTNIQDDPSDVLPPEFLFNYDKKKNVIPLNLIQKRRGGGEGGNDDMLTPAVTSSDPIVVDIPLPPTPLSPTPLPPTSTTTTTTLLPPKKETTTKVVKVGVIGDALPFSAIKNKFSKTGETIDHRYDNSVRLEGIICDVWDYFCQLNNITYEVTIVSESPVELIDKLYLGEIDVALGPIDETEQRKELVNYTFPFYEEGAEIFSKKAIIPPSIMIFLIVLGVFFFYFICCLVVAKYTMNKSWGVTFYETFESFFTRGYLIDKPGNERYTEPSWVYIFNVFWMLASYIFSAVVIVFFLGILYNYYNGQNENNPEYFAGKKVGYISGTSYKAPLISMGIIPVPFDSFPEMIDDLMTHGTIDGAASLSTIMERSYPDYFKYHTIQNTRPFTTVRFGILASKEQTSFDFIALDEFIVQLSTSGDLQSLCKVYLKHEEDYYNCGI